MTYLMSLFSTLLFICHGFLTINSKMNLHAVVPVFFLFLAVQSGNCNGAETVTVRYAKGFTVEYRGDITLVTVKHPWQGAKAKFQYILKKSDTPTPGGFEDFHVVNVPVKRIVALSTTMIAYLEKLDLVDQLVGFSDLEGVHSEKVLQAAQRGQIETVGLGANLRKEKVFELDPDIIFTFATGSFRDAHPKLLEAGLKVGIVGEYMESHPLGRSEWIKFLALFCDRGAEAERIFAELEKRYQNLAALTADLVKRPTVLTGVPFSGRWYIAGGKSFVGKFLEDAGANYIWKETQHSGSKPVDLELVYERGKNVDYWLNTGLWRSLAQAEKSDPRFIDFKSLRTGKLFNNNNRVNPQGGNDYWESGMMAPDVILADLIHIFHPKLLPDHHLTYYTHLQ